MDKIADITLSKVPEITLAFWVIKIVATTLGETGGDALSMTLNVGYAAATAIFFAFFVIAAVAQIASRKYHPALYWAAIVTTTTVGTTMADFTDRSLGVGYIGGSLLLFTFLIISLGIWRMVMGSVSVAHISSPKTEIFYWITILFSNTLGTALGDFVSDDSGLGYGGSALVFAGVIVVIAACYYLSRILHIFLFWSAFILTRPLGATLGDLLTKPHENGGLDLSRISSSAILAAFMIVCIVLFGRNRKTV